MSTEEPVKLSYYERNKEAIKEYQRAYYQKNKERMKANNQRYYHGKKNGTFVPLKRGRPKKKIEDKPEQKDQSPDE